MSTHRWRGTDEVALPGPRSAPSVDESGARGRDLAGNLPGAGVVHEGGRRRQVEGAGADRSWRVGADGEAAVAELLAQLTAVSWWGRLRGHRPEWRVLHGVPLGDGRGNERGDIDHVLVGPPGVVTINTKHHRAGRLDLYGEQLVVNGRRSDYVPKARREAERAAGFLAAAAAATGLVGPELAGRMRVRPLVVVVGARLLVRERAPGVNVVMTDRLLSTLRALPSALVPDEVDAVFELARRASTWNPPPACPGRD